MQRLLGLLAAGTAMVLLAATAHAAGTGTISKAVGGYTFEDAAKESPNTKNFHSKDGHLTFAIVTHTAGNGFFDPTAHTLGVVWRDQGGHVGRFVERVTDDER